MTTDLVAAASHPPTRTSPAGDLCALDPVLVANRGEIAVRVIATLRRLGLGSVAVYSDADVDSPHVRAADMAVRLGPAAAAESYLNIDALLAAAEQTGAAAIHPGYGFLAENSELAHACDVAGLAFIGPPAWAIEAMGDKIRAKDTAHAAGVAGIPGRNLTGLDDAAIREAVRELGLPVLLKPSAGGGGKGMRAVYAESELDDPDLVGGVRRQALAAFGEDTLLAERLVSRPRHIEVQILADQHGNVLHLGERECSLQRRHQKIIEEAPSTVLDDVTRREMGAAAVRVAKQVGYVGAGTVEFLISADKPDDFFFMEMNTRLQVEHRVTELVTEVCGQRSLDLVEWQLRIAAGEALPFAESDLRLNGHAIEARIYAEDPSRDFLPTGGRVLAAGSAIAASSGTAGSSSEGRLGPDELLVDSGIEEGTLVTSDYDPLLAKVVTWAPNRTMALQRLDAALTRSGMLGVDTNVGFLRALLADDAVRAGELDTGLVERVLPDLLATADTPEHVFLTAALYELAAGEPVERSVDPWELPGAWRLGQPAWVCWRLTSGNQHEQVFLRGRADRAEVLLGSQGGLDSAEEPAVVSAALRSFDRELTVVHNGLARHYSVAQDGDTLWLGYGGQAWQIRETPPLAREHEQAAAVRDSVASPLPGRVLRVDVEVGQSVRHGQSLFVVEAMKMEHAIASPMDGVVKELFVHQSDSVARDQELAILGKGIDGV